MGKKWKQWQTLFSWAPKITAALKLKDTPWKKSYEQPRQRIKKQRHYFANKVPSSQSYGFSSSHVWMWELHHEESWSPKNWCFWTVALEKTLENPLDCKVIQPVNPKGNQSWYSLEELMLKLKLQYFGTWCKELTHWKRPWYWERLKAGREGDDRGWNGWMASPTWWTWVWASSGSWWWTGKPCMLQSRGSQRVRHDWATELKWYRWNHTVYNLWIWAFFPHSIIPWGSIQVVLSLGGSFFTAECIPWYGCAIACSTITEKHLSWLTWVWAYYE